MTQWACESCGLIRDDARKRCLCGAWLVVPCDLAGKWPAAVKR